MITAKPHLVGRGRADRMHPHGGGVLLAIRWCKSRQHRSPSYCEADTCVKKVRAGGRPRRQAPVATRRAIDRLRGRSRRNRPGATEGAPNSLQPVAKRRNGRDSERSILVNLREPEWQCRHYSPPSPVRWCFSGDGVRMPPARYDVSRARVMSGSPRSALTAPEGFGIRFVRTQLTGPGVTLQRNFLSLVTVAVVGLQR